LNPAHRSAPLKSFSARSAPFSAPLALRSHALKETLFVSHFALKRQSDTRRTVIWYFCQTLYRAQTEMLDEIGIIIELCQTYYRRDFICEESLVCNKLNLVEKSYTID